MPQALIPTLTSFFGALTGSSLAATVLAHVTVAGVTMVGANLLAPKLDFGSANTRRSLNVRGSNQRNATTNRQYIYGQVKVGGTVAYMGTSGSDNEFLHMVLVHCDHEVEELGDLYVNGELVEMAAGGEGVLRTTSSSSDRFYQSLYIADHLGGPSQTSADSTLDAATGEINSSDAFKGMAYTYVRMELKQPDEANPDEENAFPSGVPQFQRVVKGMKVYDPREVSHDPADSTTWEYSSNWALCIGHFLQSDFGYGRYGMDYDEINEAELIASANNSDEEINELWTAWSASEEIRAGMTRSVGSWLLYSGTTSGTTGTTQPDLTSLVVGDTVVDNDITWTLRRDGINSGIRYELNGMVDSHEDPIEVLRKMKTAGAGMVEFIGGEWFVRSGRYIAPTITLSESDFAGGISGTTKDDRTNATNTVKGVIVDKHDSYNVIDAPSISNATFVTEDGGVESVREMELLFTNSHKAAQRLFKIELNRSRQSISHKATFTSKAMQLQVGDVFQLNFAKYGYVNKIFEVWSHRLVIDNGALSVEMEFREAAANMYDWDHTTDETALDPSPNTTLPSPFTVPQGPTPTITSGTATLVQTADGTINPTMHVSWTPVDDANVIAYELRWERFLNQYEYMTINGRNSSTAVIGGVVEDSTYGVQIRCITTLKIGKWGNNVDHDVVGKSASPTAPTGFAATAIVEGVKLSMSEHPDLDFKQFLIYQNTTNSKPGTHSYVTTDTTKTITGLTAGQQYYFWLEAEDTTGHTTAAASNVNSTPTATAAGDVTGLGALAAEDTVDLTTTSPGGVSGVLPTTNTDATDNGATIDTSGNIDAEINLNANGAVAVGKTSSISTTSGFWLGTDGASDYDFHIGNSSNSLKWDGSESTLTVKGDLAAGTIDIGGGSDALSVNSSGVCTFGPTSANSHIKLESDASGGTSMDLYDTTAARVGYISALNGQQGGVLSLNRSDNTHSVAIDGGSGTIYSTNQSGSQASFVIRNAYTSPTRSFTIDSFGELGWGTGSSSPYSADTNLYRDAANVLRTDDTFEVGTDLIVDGQVAIGNSTSNYTLDVNGTGRFTSTVRFDGQTQNYNGAYDIYRSGAGYLRHRIADQTLHIGVTNTAGTVHYPIVMAAASDVLIFNNEEGEMARFDTSGNLGIGTASPSAKLQVAGSAIVDTNLHVKRDSDAWSATTWINISDYGVLNTGGSYATTLNGNGYRNNSGQWTSFGAGSTPLYGATQIWQYPAGYMTFNANSSWTSGSSTVVSERMRIHGDGSVSIGTTSGGYKLRVAGNFYLEDDLRLANRLTTDGHIQLYNGTAATGYAIGVESNTLFQRANVNHRWYIGTLADGGTSDYMNLSTSGLTINANCEAELFESSLGAYFSMRYQSGGDQDIDLRVNAGNLEWRHNGGSWNIV